MKSCAIEPSKKNSNKKERRDRRHSAACVSCWLDVDGRAGSVEKTCAATTPNEVGAARLVGRLPRRGAPAGLGAWLMQRRSAVRRRAAMRRRRYETACTAVGTVAQQRETDGKPVDQKEQFDEKLRGKVLEAMASRVCEVRRLRAEVLKMDCCDSFEKELESIAAKASYCVKLAPRLPLLCSVCRHANFFEMLCGSQVSSVTHRRLGMAR